MISILFICEHNSARSQMAEAYLQKYGAGKFEVDSAGLEPGLLNPYVIDVMLEDGIDISSCKTNSVFSYFQEERSYNIIVTVCSPEVSDRCPIFPGKTIRLNWPFADPSLLLGPREEILFGVRKIRNQIKAKVIDFIAEYEEKGLKLFFEENGV